MSSAGAAPYRLVVPQGWTRLPVDPHGMRTAVRAMLLRKFAHLPRDATAALRRDIERELVGITRGPGNAYMRMLLVLDLQVDRHALTATCLVSLLPQQVAGEQALVDLAASMAGGAIESVVEDLGANRGVVVVRDAVMPMADDAAAPDLATTQAAQRYAQWLAAAGDPDAAALRPPEAMQASPTTRSVDVFLPMPDAPRVLLLSFSTSVLPLFGPLTTLFLTIASTVQWQRDDERWS